RANLLLPDWDQAFSPLRLQHLRKPVGPRFMNPVRHFVRFAPCRTTCKDNYSGYFELLGQEDSFAQVFGVDPSDQVIGMKRVSMTGECADPEISFGQHGF